MENTAGVVLPAALKRRRQRLEQEAAAEAPLETTEPQAPSGEPHVEEPAPAETPSEPETPPQAAAPEPAPAEPESVEQGPDPMDLLDALAQPETPAEPEPQVETPAPEPTPAADPAEVAALRAEIVSLRETVSGMQSGALDFSPVDVTAEEEATFGSSGDYIRKMVAAGINALLPEIMKPTYDRILRVEEVVAGMRTAVERTSQSTGAIQRDRLNASLQERVPNAQEILRSTAFREFLQQQAPFGAGTYQSILRAAMGRNDVDAIVDVLLAFKPEAKTEALRNPSVSSGAPVPPPEVHRLTMQDRQDLSHKLRTGQITQAEYNRRREEFDKAEAEGRFDT